MLEEIKIKNSSKSWWRRLLPYPFFAFVFFIFWLCLNGWNAKQAFLALLLSLSSCYLLRLLEVKELYLHNKFLFIPLLGHLIKDVVKGHLKLIGAVFFRKKFRKRETIIIHVQLTVKDENALALLSCVMALTPGAIWLAYNSKKHSILVHLFDKDDKEKFIYSFQNTYENYIKKIFTKNEI